MNTLHRRMLSALLALLLAGQTLPLALAAPEASESEEEIPVLEESAAADREAGHGEIAITPDEFPDDLFRQWLEDGANLNGYGTDGIFTQEELANIREIRVAGLGIRSLEGIQVFSALEVLSCGDNRLTELNLRGNPALNSLRCADNQIARLDLTGLEHLTDLVCESNHMTELILTGCTVLENLYARNNDLPKIDFSDNRNLKFVEIFDNRLEQVDLSMLKQLEFIHLDHNRLTHLDLSHNTELSPIGSGFVARNNFLETLVLPVRSGLLVDPDVYAEQDPKTGYNRVEWYEDGAFTRPVTQAVAAQGQTLYAKWLPNDYTIRYDSNGGSGTVAAQSAVWDTPVTLAENAFSRRGYRFTGWENSYGDGRTYPAGQEVTNLSGKNQGDRVTLYAQWQAISYTVAFDPGQGGSGFMSSQTYTYDREEALPRNTLTAPQGKEFAGWALTPGGPVRYGDEAQVWNLTATEGETITLYAVWRDPVRNTYFQQLEAAYSRYREGDYTSRDWAALVQIFDNAQKSIENAEQESGMQTACSEAIREMAAVSTCQARAEAVINAWRSAHGPVMEQADGFAVDESNAAAIQEAAGNVAGVLTVAFTRQVHGDLTEPTDLEQVTALALASAQGTLQALHRLETAAEWVRGLDGLSVRPLSQVTSQWQSAYEAAAAEASSHTMQLTGGLKEALNIRAALAQEKKQAVARLTADYQGYDLAQYSQKGREQLAAAFRTGTDNVESAEATDAVHAQLKAAQADLRAVPDQAQENQPGGTPGGETGGGGGSGGGGSAGGGGGSTATYAIRVQSTGSGTVTAQPETGAPGDSIHIYGKPENGWHLVSVIVTDSKGVQLEVREQESGVYTFRMPDTEVRVEAVFEADVPGTELPFEDVAKTDWYFDAVAYVYQKGIMGGYSDQAFGPVDRISRAQLAQLFYNLEGRPAAERPTVSYPDAVPGAWYTSAVAWAAENGILTGYQDGLLKPGGAITRAQLAAMLYRYARYKGYDVSQQVDLSGFTDSQTVAPYAREAMAWACAAGILRGTAAGTLEPNGTASRGQTAVMLMRFCENTKS